MTGCISAKKNGTQIPVPNIPNRIPTEPEISFEQFIAKTHEFQRERPLLVVSNNALQLIDLLAGEASELAEALRDNKGVLEVVSEVGDLIHFYNDLLQAFDISPQDFVLQNGKPLTTVADFKYRSVDLAIQGYPELETMPLLDVIEILIQQCKLLAFFLQDDLVKKAGFTIKPKEIDEETVTDVVSDVDFDLQSTKKYIMRHLLYSIFLLSNRLHVDLVFAGMLKNRRNRLKYPLKIMSSSDPDQYDIQVGIAKAEWYKQGGDTQFFAQAVAEYPEQFAKVVVVSQVTPHAALSVLGCDEDLISDSRV